MTKVKAEDYTKIGDISYQELLAYSESLHRKQTKMNLIDIFVEYAYRKFELSQYILRTEMVDAIFLKKDEKMLLYEVYIKKKYIEKEEDIVEDVKKIIGLQT